MEMLCSGCLVLPTDEVLVVGSSREPLNNSALYIIKGFKILFKKSKAEAEAIEVIEKEKHFFTL